LLICTENIIKGSYSSLEYPLLTSVQTTCGKCHISDLQDLPLKNNEHNT